MRSEDFLDKDTNLEILTTSAKRLREGIEVLISLLEQGNTIEDRQILSSLCKI